MTVSLGSGGVITITGTESSLANMNTGAALATGCTLISYGAAPATVRRLALLSAARILLQGTLAWNPENEEFFVSSDVPAGSGSLSDGGGGAFEVQNNGFLDIGGEATGPGAETGTDDGITYTKGTAISCAELGTGSYAATDIRNAMIYARPGSRVRIRGCTLVSESPSRFDGASGPFAACNLEIRDVVWVNGRKQTTNFFAPRIYTDNYTIRNLTMIGGTLQIQARGASASIDGIRPERMAGGIAVPGNNFGTDTDFYTLRGFDGKHNSTQDASVFNAQKLRIRNSRTGSDVNVDLQSLGHTGRSYGCIEVDQEVRFVCRDVAGNPIQGVRFHYNDFIDGRFSDAMPTNPDNWLAKNTFGSPPLGGQPSAAVIYNVQKSGSRVSNNLGICEFVGDDAVLLASKVYNDRPGSGNPVQPNPLVAKPFKYRGLNNNNTDIMPFYGDSYRHLQAALNVTCKSDTVLETSVTYVDDPSVTQTDMLLVAAYLGIAINHVTDTITITTLRLLDALYDYLKWEKTQAGSEVHPTRATMVANADGTILDLGAYNLVVGTNGDLRAGSKFRSIRTTGTVSVAGSGTTRGKIGIGYEDASGKSILLKLGGTGTAVVWDSDGGTTLNWVAPDPTVSETRIPVPPTSTVEITAKRNGYDYRHYTISAADVAELDIELPRNPNVDISDDMNVRVLAYHELRTSNYNGNVYFDKSVTPHVLRLGNVTLSGDQALTRAVFDRRMGSRAALEATHAYTGGGRAYDIHANRMRWNLAWITIGRQPTVANLEAVELTKLRKLASWGLYVLGADDATRYTPSTASDYFVTIDPLTNPFQPPPSELAAAGQQMARNAEFQAALGAAAAQATDATLEPRLDEMEADVKALGRQLKSLPIDELLQVDTRLQDIPRTTSTANIWSGIDPGTEYAVDAGNLRFDVRVDTSGESYNIAGTLSLEGFAAKTVTPESGDRTVLKVTVQCQALTGETRYVDPDIRWDWDAPTAPIPERRALGHMVASHPVSVLAPTAGLGPAYTIEYDMAHTAAFTLTDVSFTVGAKVRNANEYLRIVITSIEWVTRHEATLADFRADLSAIDLSNLDVKVSSRMPASDFLPPYRIILPTYDGTKGEGATNGASATDDDFAADGAFVQRSGAIHQTGEIRRAVWTFPSVNPTQDISISASLQWKRPDGEDFDSGTRAQAAMTATLYVGTDLDGTTDTGATSVLSTTVPHGAQAAQRAVSLALTDPQRAPFNSIMLKVEGGTVGQQNRAYLWDLKVEVDGQRYMLDRIRFIDRINRAQMHTTAERTSFIEGGETILTFTRRAATVSTDWSGGRE